jgi:hypothetical protein
LTRFGQNQEGSGGDERPPRQPSGIPVRDDYQKEKAEIKKYFSTSDIKSALKDQQAMQHAAIAVRTLVERGIKLEDYEPGLPQDYKLEVLRRSGQFEHIMIERNLARYVPTRGSRLTRYITKEDFAEGSDVKDPGRYRLKGMKSWQDIFEKGIPCIDLSNTDYESHIADRREWDYKRDITYKGTDSAFISCTESHGDAKYLLDMREREQVEAYIIDFIPRGLHYVDAEASEAIGALTGLAAAEEREKSVIGLIDHRDIIAISVYRNGKLIEKHNNPNFIKG